MSVDPAFEKYLPFESKIRSAKESLQQSACEENPLLTYFGYNYQNKDFDVVNSLESNGGCYNPINLSLYNYAGNNPIKYSDPDGNAIWVPAVALIGAAVGAAVSVGAQVAVDLMAGKTSSVGTYVGAGVGGALGGAILASTGNSMLAGLVGSGVASTVLQIIDNGNINLVDTAIDTAVGAAIGKLISGPKITGQGSISAVTKQIETKLANKMISNISNKTAVKVVASRAIENGLLESTLATTAAGEIKKEIVSNKKK